MSEHAWFDGFPGAITVCDENLTIVSMNDKAAEAYKEDGGRALIGRDLRFCHPPAARAKLEDQLATRERNVYTIQKRGVRKLIYQTPWYRDGRFAGIVELSLEIPQQMPEFVRQG